MIQVVFELLDTQYNMVSNFLCKSKEERDSDSNFNHLKIKLKLISVCSTLYEVA